MSTLPYTFASGVDALDGALTRDRHVPVITAASAGTTIAGTVIAGASGWSSPTGLAAFITAVVGFGAFVWSVVQQIRKRREIDVETAAELIKAMTRDD